MNQKKERVDEFINVMRMDLLEQIKSRKWTELLRTTKEIEYLAREWITENSSDGTEIWKSLPIHLVCEKNPPQKVVKQLYELYPESLEIRNSGDDLPLHVLCRSCPDQNESIKYLANCFPKALEMKGSEGCLPLHLLCQKGADVKVVEEIYVHFPMASRSRDEFGLLPLHWACLKNSPLEIIEFLIRTCPPALEWQDNWGRIPRDIYEKQHLRSCDEDEEDKEKLSLLSLDQQHTPESFWTLEPLYQIKDLKEESLQTQQKLEQCSTDRDRFVEENSILKKRLENVEMEKTKQEESWEKELDFLQWDKEQIITEYETQSQILQKELEKIQDAKHEMEQDVKELRKSDSIKDQTIQNLKKQNDFLRIQLKTFSHYLTDTLAGNIQSANEVLDVSFKEESRNDERPTRNFTDKKKIKRRAPQRVFHSTIQPKREDSRQIICLDRRDKVYY